MTTDLGRVLAILVPLLLCRFLLPPGSQAQEAKTLVRADSVDVVLQVRGMACDMCAQNMKRSLESMAEVESARVDLETQRVQIRRTDQGTLSEEMLRETVTDAGYQFQDAVFEDETETSNPMARHYR